VRVYSLTVEVGEGDGVGVGDGVGEIDCAGVGEIEITGVGVGAGVVKAVIVGTGFTLFRTQIRDFPFLVHLKDKPLLTASAPDLLHLAPCFITLDDASVGTSTHDNTSA